MKVLVVAYEYPPSPSPQSLRWAYLARELAILGNEVHVMVPDAHYGRMDMVFDSPGVRVHKVFAGPGMGLVVRAARMKRELAASARTRNAHGPADGMVNGASGQELNWKGRLLRAYHRSAGALLFPDIRSEWTPWARGAMRRLLHQTRPDVVVTSHEPASTLPLGMMAKRFGFRWVADLGDPVLAGYTPRRHRARAWRLERRTCLTADAVVVTDATARDVLMQRHALAPGTIDVVTQGYPAREPNGHADDEAMPGLNLVYTGSIYVFRPIDPLLEAISASEGVTLHVAAVEVPASLRDAARREPSKFVIHGHMPHNDALSLQGRADVVVNIGNELEAQVPGKLYEYLSSGRPILHLQSWDTDPGAKLIERLGRGWVVANEAAAIQALLGHLACRKAKGLLQEDIDVSGQAVEQYRWDQLARRYEGILRRVAKVDNAARQQESDNQE